MLTARDMAKRAAREVSGAATVYVSSSLRGSLELPPGVALETDADASVDVAIVAAERVSIDGRMNAEAFPTRARHLVALVASTSPGSLVAAGRLADAPDVRVDRILTPLGVLDRVPEGLRVREVPAGVSAADVQRSADAPLLAGPDLALIEPPPERG